MTNFNIIYSDYHEKSKIIIVCKKNAGLKIFYLKSFISYYLYSCNKIIIKKIIHIDQISCLALNKF